MIEPEPYSPDDDRTVPDDADSAFGGPDEDSVPAPGRTYLPEEADPADVFEQTQVVPVDDEERT